MTQAARMAMRVHQWSDGVSLTRHGFIGDFYSPLVTTCEVCRVEARELHRCGSYTARWLDSAGDWQAATGSEIVEAFRRGERGLRGLMLGPVHTQ